MCKSLMWAMAVGVALLIGFIPLMCELLVEDLPRTLLMRAEECVEACEVQRFRMLSWTPVDLQQGVCVCGDAAGLWAQDR